MNEEKESAQRIEKRKEQIKTWLKNRNNLALIIVMALAFAILLYYFLATKNQPLWWDEAEYMLKAKSMALGTPSTGWWDGRPILFPFILSLLMMLGFNEISLRLLLLVISLASVYLIYYIGMALFQKKIGIIAAFFYSLFYLNLFYSMRLLTDIISVFFGLLGFAFFLSKKQKLIWLCIPAIAIASLLRFPLFLFFIILVIYILATEANSFYKNKDYGISLVLGSVVGSIYLLWSYLRFGNPLYALSYAGGGAIEGITFGSGLSVLKQYLFTFPNYFHTILLIILLFSFLYLFEVLIGLDIIFKNKNHYLSSKFFLFIWIFIIFAYFSFGVSHYEDRYVFPAFPALFYLIALMAIEIQTRLLKYGKLISLIFIVAVIVFGSYALVAHSNSIIKERVSSFESIKNAGLWIKENSNSEDRVLIRSHPQNTYYSERESYSIPLYEEDFAANLSAINPKYVVISLYDSPSDPNWWGYSFNYTKYNLVPVNFFPKNNPQVIVYLAA